MLRFGTINLWLGGTSIPSSWLHNSCLKISAISFCHVIIVHELCVFENDLYVVEISGLATFHVGYYNDLYASVLWL
jgi:hypothetical protein